MTDWQTIDTAPDDFQRPGGQRPVLLRNRDGRETTGRRTLFNNSGWREESTNRELWPTHWAYPPDEIHGAIEVYFEDPALFEQLPQDKEAADGANARLAYARLASQLTQEARREGLPARTVELLNLAALALTAVAQSEPAEA